MATKASDGWLLSVGILLCRASMGMYLLLAGWGKIQSGVGNFVEQRFRGLQPAWLPNALGTPYAYSIPFLEVGLGALLVLGLLMRPAAALATIMIGSFTVALVLKNQPLVTGREVFTPNLIYVGLLFLLAVLGAGQFSLDALWGRSLSVTVSAK